MKELQNQVSTLKNTFTRSEIGLGSEIGAAFKQGFENVKAFLVSMINIWPFMIILFLLIFCFRKRMKRSNS